MLPNRDEGFRADSGRTDEAPTQGEREEMPEHLFGDPENKKYPLDTPEHIRAASSYVEKEHEAGRLSDAKYKEIRGRINAAEKKHGIGQDDGGLTLAVARSMEDAGETSYRFDLASGELGERTRTSIGGVVAKARLTRTGVFPYQDPSMPGGVRRELRHPDEVFDTDSLDSLAHVPVTDDHPAGRVTPDNFRDESIGHVAGRPKRDGKFVAGELHINHGPAVQKAEAGKLVEVSLGYHCRYVPGEGTYNGEPFDGRQTRIRYNHAAVGPQGWGRAGSEVRMHLDAIGASVCDPREEAEGVLLASRVHGDSSPDPRGGIMPMTPEEQKAFDDAKKRADAAEAAAKVATDAAKAAEQAAKDEKARADKATADKAIVEGEAKTLRTQVERENSDAARETARKAHAAEIAEGVRIHKDAEDIFAGDETWKADGKSTEQIMSEAIAKMDPEFKLDELLDTRDLNLDAAAAPIYRGKVIRRQYALVKANWDKVRKANGELEFIARRDGRKPGDGDDDEDDEAEDARDQMIKRNNDRFKNRDAKRDTGASMPGSGKGGC